MFSIGTFILEALVSSMKFESFWLQVKSALFAYKNYKIALLFFCRFNINPTIPYFELMEIYRYVLDKNLFLNSSSTYNVNQKQLTYVQEMKLLIMKSL